MGIDVYSATGQKTGTKELPSVFMGRINEGLMHQALMRQQGNRRAPIAHAKSRGEVVGSTKKMYDQKHTGRARRGPGRSPLLRGGGKAFGPKSVRNFETHMPLKMRHAAMASCLSFLAKNGRIVGLESYGDTVKTKTLSTMLKKMPVELGRRIVVVIPGAHKGMELSARNVPNLKTLQVSYLNPEDLLTARSVIFLTEAIDKAQEMLGGEKTKRVKKAIAEKPTKEKAEKPVKEKATTKKAPAKKKTTSKKSE